MSILLKIITIIYSLMCLPLSLLLISDVSIFLKITVLVFIALAIVLIKVSFFSKNKTVNKSAEEQRKETNQNQDIRYLYSKTKKLVPDFVVLDFETTGLSPTDNQVIQVAAVRYRNFAKIDEFVTFINPGISIPPKITEITGITNRQVKNSPLIQTVLPQLIDFIGEDVIVAHNAEFDMGFLIRNIEKHNLELKRYKVIDTLQLARSYISNSKNHKLQTLKSYLGLDQYSSHEALSDCLVTGELYKYCYDKSKK